MHFDTEDRNLRLGQACRDAVLAQAARPTPGIGDIAAYCAAHNHDASHREIVGPLLPVSGPSGLVVHGGEVVASWGDPAVPEMAFSATKSVVALVAGLAYDDGLLRPHDPVPAAGSGITWHHLLQQTSGWDGVLWGKPAAADAQSRGVTGRPGERWAYNDVRVNLLCHALTELLGRPLPDVLAERVMAPIGASRTWSWHGYAGAGAVSGGAHWGGGLWISAADLALLGGLLLDRGRDVLSSGWIERCWTPCDVKPDYGYLWWLNDTGSVFPDAARTGRCARGNLGRHLLWVDPARDLVVVSRWGEDVGTLLAALR